MATTCLKHRCYVTVQSGYCDDHRPRRTAEENRERSEQPHRKLNKRRGATAKAHLEQSTCWLCGHHEQPPAAKFDSWMWHHTVPGDPDCPQVLTHGFCNVSYGDGSRWRAGLVGVALWRSAKIEEGKIREAGTMPLL